MEMESFHSHGGNLHKARRYLPHVIAFSLTGVTLLAILPLNKISTYAEMIFFSYAYTCLFLKIEANKSAKGISL